MTYEDIKQIVRKNAGVSTFRMADLRDAQQAGKLGKHVRTAISERLSELGLEHWPEDLPEYQHQAVRIFQRDSLAGELIAAVNDVSPESDVVIRSVVQGKEKEILRKIRLLVQE